MGGYYGLINITRKIVVNSYWKNDPMCDIHEVMHMYRWKITDDIICIGGCQICRFKHCEKLNTMIPVDEDLGNFKIPNTTSYLTIKFDSVVRDKYFANDRIIDDEPLALGDLSNDDIYPDSESSKSSDLDEADHAPIWIKNKCTMCNYLCKNT